ncbi:MAG: DNA polymerase I [Gammaproteobacteria bacterium]|nr:DNA polymerase I [Gammaproteobacteria bacterium]
MADKPLVLVDGSSYLYRAYHALPDLSTQDGQPTGALLGVLNMVYKLMDEHSPERMAVVFDAPGRTFRDDLFAEYKAHRPPMPDELRSQIEPLIEAIEMMGVPVLRIPGVEADDVIGTLADDAADAGVATIISTSDKDMAQLVGERVTLVNTMDNTTLDPAGVAAKFGVPPDRITDYLALVGDTSDNIPGVRGVGAKTAAKWLEQYGTLEALVAHSGEVRGKVGERLRDALGELDLYKRLATIDRDCELPLGFDALTVKPPREEELRELYQRLELTSLLRRRLPQPPAGAEPAPDPDDVERRYDIVLTERALDEWLETVTSAPIVAVDTATTGVDYMRAELVGLSLSAEPGRAAYIPIGHRYPGAPEQLAADLVLSKLRPWLESSSPKVGHHGKFHAHVLGHYGIEIGGLDYDSMLESYVLNSVATRHDIGSVAAKYLGMDKVSVEDVCGKGAKQISFDQLDIDNACRYAAEGADVTLRLHQTLWPKLRQVPELEKLYGEIEQPLVRVLRSMERAGVKVDADMLRRQSQELAEAMARTEAAAHVEAGGPFAIGSPKQLQEVLYERLALPVLGKTPKGQPSTAENVLQELARTYDLPRLILEYRALAKLKSTYTDKLPLVINPQTGRIHTCYHQAVAATGRLSSTDPNLQNIPIRTPEGRRIRQAFVAAPGYTLLAADYSQIELRIMAHLSGDEGLLAAFAAREDIHRATAAEVFGMPLDAVTPDQRRSAKAINFGLIYGMSAFGLARQLGVERGEAQTYIDLYFQRYPGVKRYMDDTRRLAREQGYVTTVFGRRLYLPEINDRNAQRRQYAERSAINAPMQGTAADIIKRAMLKIHAWLSGGDADARLIMQVHDELVLEVREAEAADVARQVVALMESAGELSVPLQVDAGTGPNWDEAH